MLINPQAMSPTRRWPYGGSFMSELILASCLAIAEHSRHGGGNGSRRAYFLERLAAAISADEQNSVPDSFGINTDGSTRSGYRSDRTYGVDVTFNNVLY